MTFLMTYRFIMAYNNVPARITFTVQAVTLDQAKQFSEDLLTDLNIEDYIFIESAVGK